MTLINSLFILVFFLILFLLITRNPFSMLIGLLLIFVFLGILFFIFSDFLGLLILLVYSGGIAVMFIFTCFPMNLQFFLNKQSSTNTLLLVTLLCLKVLLLQSFFSETLYLTTQEFDLTILKSPLKHFSEALYLQFPILLIIISLILLLAMVGALAIVRSTL